MALMALHRRAFLAGSGLVVACSRGRTTADALPAPPEPSTTEEPLVDAAPPFEIMPSTHALFAAYPALGEKLPRIELGRFPSRVERANDLGDAEVWIKRDDDIAELFGGGKVRKLELFFGEARALGKKRIITSGGVGSNQALAVALLGKANGFSVALHLAPQPRSTLTTKNLGADAASSAAMRLFGSVTEAHATALAEAKNSSEVYVVPPGGTTPLGTLGFVAAGLELARDVAEKRAPLPRRIYVALGLGGTAVGLALGLAMAKMDTEVVAVRTSNPGTITRSTLRAIHEETVTFARVRDETFPKVRFAEVRLRIDDRFVGGGYGVPTSAGDSAIERARRTQGWELDPVYTGKALAALLEDARDPSAGPLLFWNTASSRVVATAPIPPPFERFAQRPGFRS
jgi:D-cysteine desulfhydrase